MRDLDTIGRECGTDKSSSFHNYLRTYEHYLSPWRTNPIRLLEFGVWHGASIRMWAEYFTHPNRQIHCLDNDPQWLKNLPPGTRTYCGDSNAWRFLNDAFSGLRFEIIIDDGDHHPISQLNLFLAVFPFLKSGGVYIIEDLHFAGFPGYLEVATEALRVLNRTLEPDCGDPDKATSGIAFVHCYRSLLVIGKK